MPAPPEAPPNERPPNVGHAELPEWAQRAVGPMDAETAERYGFYATKNRLGCLVGAMGLVYAIGLGLLGWAVLGLRSSQLVAWRWLVGAGAVVIGAALFALARRRAPGRADGVVLAPEGIVIIDGDQYRFVAREDIAEVRFEEGRLEAALPDALRRCTAIQINSVRGGIGAVVGAETCVDGHLGGVEGCSGFAFELVTAEDGSEAIDAWRSGACRGRQ